MSVSNLVTAVKSGKFDLDDTTSMGSTPFCRVCLNANHKTLRCEQVKNIQRLFACETGTFHIGETEKRVGTNSPAKIKIVVCTV